MSPADNNLTAQPTAAPDGTKPSVRRKRSGFLGRFGVSESIKSPASNNPTTRSMDNMAAPDGKSTAKRFLGGSRGSQSTKNSLISSTSATHSTDNLAALGASAVHLAANIGKHAHHLFAITHRQALGVATAPTVPEVAASIQVVTRSTHVSCFNISHLALTFYAAVGTTPTTNVDQGSPATPAATSSTLAMNVDQGGSVTPAAASPTSAMNLNEHSSSTIVPNLVASQNNPARNPESLANVNQAVPPGPDVSQDQNKFKEGMDVALDGCLTALVIAKEASDWNPFLKAALGGVMAVINLANVRPFE
ncbi:hypothetical protein DXG01_008580 [Tephrocybe rancida]|nr:hypothetical protein DXG01_008580 [Tephrocybe rancida]